MKHTTKAPVPPSPSSLSSNPPSLPSSRGRSSAPRCSQTASCNKDAEGTAKGEPAPNEPGEPELVMPAACRDLRRKNDARTLPPNPQRIRPYQLGRRLTDAEWNTLKALRRNPAFADHFLRQGEQEDWGVNRYFIRFHRQAKNGEEWGTKEQLINHRRRQRRYVRDAQARRRERDPEFRRQNLNRLAELNERRREMEEHYRQMQRGESRLTASERRELEEWAADRRAAKARGRQRAAVRRATKQKRGRLTGGLSLMNSEERARKLKEDRAARRERITKAAQAARGEQA